MNKSDMNNIESTDDYRTTNNVVRHEYRILSQIEKNIIQKIKDDGLNFIDHLNTLSDNRQLSIAKIKIEEAVMWAVKSVTK